MTTEQNPSIFTSSKDDFSFGDHSTGSEIERMHDEIGPIQSDLGFCGFLRMNPNTGCMYLRNFSFL